MYVCMYICMCVGKCASYGCSHYVLYVCMYVVYVMNVCNVCMYDLLWYECICCVVLCMHLWLVCGVM